MRIADRADQGGAKVVARGLAGDDGDPQWLVVSGRWSVAGREWSVVGGRWWLNGGHREVFSLNSYQPSQQKALTHSALITGHRPLTTGH
jgi:hypothetical protein